MLSGDREVVVVYGKGGRAGGWCRPKRVWSLSASLCKGLSSRNALGPSPSMCKVQVDLCFPQHSREHGCFECVLRVEVRGWCSYMWGSGGSQGTSQRFEGRQTRSTRATRAERNDFEGPLVATKRVDAGRQAGAGAINRLAGVPGEERRKDMIKQRDLIRHKRSLRMVVQQQQRWGRKRRAR